MKSHRHIVIIVALALTGCASGGSSHLGKSSQTEYIRDANGTTQYRIREGNVFTPNGTRVARIDSSGNIFNTSGSRVGKISKR
jgi:hypothetical protein